MYCSLACATASCDCTTSMFDVTPAANRSRDCVNCRSGQLSRSRGRLQFFFRRLQIEEGRAHVVVDLCLRVLSLSTPRPQLRIGLGEPPLDASAFEDRNAQRADDAEGGKSATDVQADRTVVRGHPHRRKCLADNGPPRRFRFLYAFLCRQIVRPLTVRPRERLFECHLGHGNKRDLLTELEQLSRGQTDHSRELQLGLLEVVGCGGHTLALGDHSHFGTNDVDPGDQSTLPQTDRLLMKRRRRFELGASGHRASLGCQRLQIQIRGNQDDQIARAARLNALRR